MPALILICRASLRMLRRGIRVTHQFHTTYPYVSIESTGLRRGHPQDTDYCKSEAVAQVAYLRHADDVTDPMSYGMSHLGLTLQNMPVIGLRDNRRNAQAFRGRL